MELQLSVGGMHCQACVRRLQKSLEKVPAARVIEVTVGGAKVELQGASRHDIEAAVQQAGFSVEAAP
jgi:copper chaperone CopZ